MDSSARRKALVRLLRRSARRTVAELADELAVSRRTVLRDLAVLRDRGFSISGDGGRGGGVQMDPNTILLSTQLAADEVVALVLSVAMLRATPWVPFSDRADRALEKIEGALPAERLRDLRRLLSRVLVGEPAPLDEFGTPDSVDTALLGAFQQAFTQREVLEFRYQDRRGRHTARTVEPHALLVRAPFWYILAWDQKRSALRQFRMDRIRTPRARTGETFAPRSIELSGVCPDAKALSPPRPSVKR
ncbi:MAG: helix-turn-helix transcriptional regulator [Nannocystales bacterium]